MSSNRWTPSPRTNIGDVTVGESAEPAEMQPEVAARQFLERCVIVRHPRHHARTVRTSPIHRSVGCRRELLALRSRPTASVDGWRMPSKQAVARWSQQQDAEALVWAEPAQAKELDELLHDAAAGVKWVQLPWAGIEPYVEVIRGDRIWTCGKGVYAKPVAEHALTLLLAGLRGLDVLRRSTWTRPAARTCSMPRSRSSVGAGSPNRCFASSSRSARMSPCPPTAPQCGAPRT